jgi:peroxiredoxin (alkyl hydroperoxide reductase subunit C)
MENLNEMKMPLIGDPLPKLKVTTTHGTKVLPDDYAGKWLVLFSHPGDFTPVCTTEFVGFAKRQDQFKELNCELLGLSIDQVYAHIKWEEWIMDNLGVEITFPIIADDGTVGKTLGMIHPNKGSNTVRAVFIIDPKGIVRAILYYPQELGRDLDEIVRMVKGLQVVDKNNVALPGNWPNNELIKDHVIIPPAKDVKTAQERKNKPDCYDWWFCHKKL